MQTMREHGVERAFTFPLNDPERRPAYRVPNDRVLAWAAASDGMLVPFCRLDLTEGPIEEAERALDAGARGIKLHPRAQAFDFGETRAEPGLPGRGGASRPDPDPRRPWPAGHRRRSAPPGREPSRRAADPGPRRDRRPRADRAHAGEPPKRALRHVGLEHDRPAHAVRVGLAGADRVRERHALRHARHRRPSRSRSSPAAQARPTSRCGRCSGATPSGPSRGEPAPALIATAADARAHDAAAAAAYPRLPGDDADADVVARRRPARSARPRAARLRHERQRRAGGGRRAPRGACRRSGTRASRSTTRRRAGSTPARRCACSRSPTRSCRTCDRSRRARRRRGPALRRAEAAASGGRPADARARARDRRRGRARSTAWSCWARGRARSSSGSTCTAAEPVISDRWDAGQAASLHAGLAALPDEADWALVVLGDGPDLDPPRRRPRDRRGAGRRHRHPRGRLRRRPLPSGGDPARPLARRSPHRGERPVRGLPAEAVDCRDLAAAGRRRLRLIRAAPAQPLDEPGGDRLVAAAFAHDRAQAALEHVPVAAVRCTRADGRRCAPPRPRSARGRDRAAACSRRRGRDRRSCRLPAPGPVGQRALEQPPAAVEP